MASGSILATVRNTAAERKRMDSERRRIEAERMLVDGKSSEHVVKTLGMSNTSVAEIRRSIARRNMVVAIPDWVPNDLRAEYEYIARERESDGGGEHAAAAWARAEKRKRRSGTAHVSIRNGGVA